MRTSLSWLCGLRQPFLSVKARKNQAFRPTFATIFDEFRNQPKRQVNDIEYKGNPTEIRHLVAHRHGPTPSIQDVHFETNLRVYNENDKRLHDKSFILIPYKNKNSYDNYNTVPVDRPICASTSKILHERMMKYLRKKREKEQEKLRIRTRNVSSINMAYF